MRSSKNPNSRRLNKLFCFVVGRLTSCLLALYMTGISLIPYVPRTSASPYPAAQLLILPHIVIASNSCLTKHTIQRSAWNVYTPSPSHVPHAP